MPRPELDAILERVPGIVPESAAVTPLGGGITNRNFRIDSGGRSFVLRVFDRGTDALGIRRDHEHAANRTAAAVGVAPEVVYFDEAAGALVTRFVSGTPLTAERARDPEVLRRIAAVIRRYHDGPAFPGRFSPFETVRSYHRLALEHDVAFPSEAGRALELMEAIERALRPRLDLRPCHNDLLAANFIEDGDRLWVLDWEYAGMGDPFFDLGNFAVNQSLDAAECEELLRAWAGAARDDDLAHLHLMRAASDMRESFWGYLQSAISTLDFDYVDYGRRHLERFLENASAPEFTRALDRLREGAQ